MINIEDITLYIKEGGILFEVAIILLIGYLFGNLANLLKMPRVSGYIVTGIIMSPYVLGLIDKEFLDKSDIITHMSLSIITFLIGSSLEWSKIKNLGKTIFAITIGEAEIAYISVFIAMTAYFYYFSDYNFGVVLAIALLFGALASPTDPAATLEVIHEYKAKGILTTTVLGVAALDDATGIMNFVLGTSIAQTVVTGNEIEWQSALLEISKNIIGAIAIGIVMGFVLKFLGEFAKERKEKVTVTFGTLFLTFSIAHMVGVDELLSTMTVGITLVNSYKRSYEFVMPIENYIEDAVFTLFFVVGSAFLNVLILAQYLPLVGAYILARFLGKYIGTFIGGSVTKAPSVIKKYLAFSLFPQGGIVIGLALLSYQNPEFREFGQILINIVIGATAIHEFMGPILSKLALKKAGEIKVEA
ncbi:cation:proton antiporter [Nitrosophilus kaiyonis]|uniref:cation:proton antiporter n=1 Tax=Nitrosophilus kaiyonis TaxID=2930200 RepID=UPI002492F1B2|nr:cation:proton antiporter [Nitrosophilus kaiyonis]